MKLLATGASKLIRNIRPASVIDERIPFRTVGWYARMGLVPAIRGLAWRPRFKAPGFPLFIGRNVTIMYARQMRLGSSVYIGSSTRINALTEVGVRIADRVTIREGGWIQCASSPVNPGHSLSIAEGTYIGPQVIIGVGGPVSIGRSVQLGAGCVLISENHATAPDGTTSATDVDRKGIQIGNNCWLGHRVTVLDGVTLGDNTTVGAGAVVTKSFPPNSIIVGSPARQVASRA